MKKSNYKFNSITPAKSNQELINYARINKIKDMITITNGRLLEVGCFDGHTVKIYKRKFKGKTYGIDNSKKALKNAAKIIDEVKLCDLNTDKIPYKKKYFDVIICGEVIEHIFNTDNLITEIYRVLKDNGILIISAPNLSSFFNRIFILFGLQPLLTEISLKKSNYGNPFRENLPAAGHIRNFTYRALKEFLEDNGFKIIKKDGVIIARHGIYLLIEKLIYYLLPKSFSNIVILKCKKKL